MLKQKLYYCGNSHFSRLASLSMEDRVIFFFNDIREKKKREWIDEATESLAAKLDKLKNHIIWTIIK